MRRGQRGIVARLGWLEGSRLGVHCAWPCGPGLLLALATKSMQANRWILQDRTPSIYTRLKYFNACVSAVVCFGGGHRTLYKKQLYALDVLFRKLCRSIATPPSDTDRSLKWYEIFHHWNDRARTFAQTAGLQPWSYRVCRQHWKLASHIANLPEHRWVRRILAWNPSVRYRSLGRRPHTWDYQIQVFLSIQRFGTMNRGSEIPSSLEYTF